MSFTWELLHAEGRVQKKKKVYPGVFLFYFFVFCLCRAAPVAYGGFQAEVKSELQLPAFATATATQDPSQVCDLNHSSWQRWILNPLSKARDLTHILMDTGWVHDLLSHSENSQDIII